MSKRDKVARRRIVRALHTRQSIYRACFEHLEQRCLLSGSGPLVISEFMADNTHTLADSDNAFSDWIEIQNPTGAPVALNGYYLTDDASNLTKWQISTANPMVNLAANGFKVIFASDKNRTNPSGQLHTNFKLSDDGEYLALVRPDGVTIASDYTPTFPSQAPDVSYGVFNGTAQYFPSPTPGTPNTAGATQIVSDTVFSVDRGFYDTSFPLMIATRTAGATIRYTTDGTKPTATTGTVYAGPITISKTTTLRAAAFKTGFVSSNVDTQTYIFTNDVVQQSNASVIAAGFPSNWNGTGADYEMDTRVTQNAVPDQFGNVYANEIRDDLKAIPTLSIVLPNADMFGSNGIYSNPTSEGQAWERSTSVELIDPNGTNSNFQIDAGIQIQGGAFRNPGLTNKHSFRILFKDIWGPSQLDQAFFGKDATDGFDSITLRADANDGWQWDAAGGSALYSRDMWSHETQLDMGDPGSHSNRVHLYINGVYWGLYDPVERPDAAFAATYIGGNKDQWDVLNIDGVTDGSGDAWNVMNSLSDAVANAPDEASRTAAYQKIQGNNPDGTDNPAFQDYLDVDNYIDYMLINIFTGNVDWPHNNWYAGRYRADTGVGSDLTGFKFFNWDAESALNLWSSLGTDQTGANASVAHAYSQLRSSADFRKEFSLRASKMLFNGGPLSNAANVSRMQGILDSASKAIIDESARWGDQHGPLYTKANWQAQANDLINNYFPQRWGIVVQQLRSAGLLTTVDPPTFSQYGGQAPAGTNVFLTAQTGSVFYTLDGSDPRLPDGSVNPAASSAAQTGVTLVPVNSNWKFWDVGTTPTPASPDWKSLAYNDASWSAGPAQLGYGDGDEATVVGFGPDSNNKYITTYFRKTFTLSNVSQYATARIRFLRDDGGVVYINGNEVVRSNMPGGTIANDTPAAGNADDSTPYYDYDIPVGSLSNGTNVIAVEIHQFAGNSSDISFNLELTATTSPTPIVLGSSDTTIKARSRDGLGNWSELSTGLFHTAADPSAANLAITEIDYHPHDPEASLGESGTSDSFEFLELMNKGAQPVDLGGVHFVQGIQYEFPDHVTLAAGERAVIVSNLTAFRSRYGNGPRVLGAYTGSLDNAGDQVILHTASEGLITSFHYQDSGGWPNRADGNGSSLEEINPAGDASDPKNWRSSVEYGGSPGTAGAGTANSIIVNEILANTDVPALDSIELYNPTGLPVNVGGWYLSDSSSNYRKFRIPAGTTIATGGYLTYSETTLGFSLASDGDDVWLLQSDLATNRLIRFVDRVEFGATPTGESLGRWPNGLASSGFYPMASTTPNAANSGPRVGPVVINEILYAPAAGKTEFIELRNVTASDVSIAGWRVSSGIDFDFPAGALVPANSYALLVAGDPTAFRTANSVPAAVPIYGNYLIGGFLNVLDNTGEQIVLSRPAAPVSGVTPYTEVDRVTYDDNAPWPTGANGSGPSLGRVNSFAWGDTPTNWAAEVTGGTPGKVNFGGVAPATTVSNRLLFYNNSTFDDFTLAATAGDAAAIAPDKSALLPGHVGAFANVSNFASGITGIFVDFAGIPTGPLTPADFGIKVGNTDAAASWSAGPAATAVTLLPGIGGANTARIALTWSAGSIKNQWVQVTVLANGQTNLAAADVFYFGNLVADSTGDGIVDSADYYAVRDHLRSYDNPAPVDWTWDVNRDGVVDITDVMLTRSSTTTPSTALRMISTPAAVTAPVTKAPASSPTPTPTPTTTRSAPTPTVTRVSTPPIGIFPLTPRKVTPPAAPVPSAATPIHRVPLVGRKWTSN